MSDCVCGFEVGDRVSFAGGEGEIVKINHRPSGQCLLHILTDNDDSKKLPAAVVDLIDSSDALLEKGEFDDPQRFNLRTRAAELDLAHRKELTVRRVEMMDEDDIVETIESLRDEVMRQEAGWS